MLFSAGYSILAHSRPDILSRLSTSRRPRLCLFMVVVFLSQEMQTLFKNLFNLIDYWEYLYSFYSLEIFLKPSVKGTLRYQKINFFTTSASLKCIICIIGISVYDP